MDGSTKKGGISLGLSMVRTESEREGGREGESEGSTKTDGIGLGLSMVRTERERAGGRAGGGRGEE